MILPSSVLALIGALAATAAYCLHPDPTTEKIVGGAWVAFVTLVKPGHEGDAAK